MLTALQRAQLLPEFLMRPFPLRRKEFQRKIAVDFTARTYRVKTVETQAELKQVLGLRRSVFHYEFARKWISLKSDKDEFDDVADHLAIFDEKNGKIAGVYRLIPSHASRRFYSSTEFDVSHFLSQPGEKLELSRACINREYRNGVVISLLWRGIAEYAQRAGTDYLFGLSSMNTVDPAQIAAVSRYFREQGLEDLSWGIKPRSPYAIDGLDAVEPADGDAARLVPPLVKTYIRAGARVCSPPVIDRAFNCADWLTVLDMRKLSAAYGRKYAVD
jgi:putative hemolysin